MASSAALLYLSSSSPSIIPPNPKFDFCVRKRTRTRRGARALTTAASSKNDVPPSTQKSTKLVTFLGKGGSGKTTSAILAAQHYAMAGLKTYLVIHSQDPTADYLLNCKIGTSPLACNKNLLAVRLETTKMLLEPLNQMKQADAHLNMTQGVLEGVLGEELGVLPGMDSLFSALALVKLMGFFGNVSQRNRQKNEFDIIVYDGIGAEETIRLIGATSKARLYFKYLRNLAERTDLGRLAGPSLVRLADEAMGLSGMGSHLDGKMSAEIWDNMEQTLERVSSIFADPHRFGCYLTLDPKSPTSVNSALRYWGCAIQAGTHVSGAFGIASPNSCVEAVKNFSPMPFACIPHLPLDSPLDWNEVVLKALGEDARELLSMPIHNSTTMPSVKFDPAKKSVTLFMPGFDKSEIKLYQYRGGSELLVEAGDQRRVIHLPSQIQGKVGGAKFIDRSLVITMR